VDPEIAGVYVLLSNIYAAAGKWDLSENVQQLRKEGGVKKQPGHTWIEVNNEVHSFVVNDQAHPQMIEIHAELEIVRSDACHGVCTRYKICALQYGGRR
jgi:hypothetical protein